MARITLKPEDLAPGVKLGSGTSHRMVITPRVVCARLSGMFFSTNKDFLLPGTFEAIRKVRRLYEAFPDGFVLIVGHTDTTGTPEVNDPLSLRRARSVEAFLKDDVQAWLDRYASSVPQAERWGKLEDDLLLSQARGFAAQPGSPASLRAFQQSRKLKVTGKADEATRKQLIKEYMDQDGTTLPAGCEATTHGCGENFPLSEDGAAVDATPDDDQKRAANRRVELFFFSREDGIDPAPPGDNSGPGSSQYPAWRKKSRERVFGAQLSELHLMLKRSDGEPLAGAAYELCAGDVALAIGTSGEDGCVQHVIAGGHAQLTLKLLERDHQVALDLGALKPLELGDGVAGAQGRLMNLCSGVPAVSGALDDATRGALLAFQRDAGLQETGTVDDASKAELIRQHGC
jgi:outer membrane protein OmpA-like peptidoglycan-associated protein